MAFRIATSKAWLLVKLEAPIKAASKPRIDRITGSRANSHEIFSAGLAWNLCVVLSDAVIEEHKELDRIFYLSSSEAGDHLDWRRSPFKVSDESVIEI